jgi:mannitol-1-phosphate 5-dehydrogenase
MARALIVGGGAIGRGFMPWLLDKFELDILDVSTELVKGMTRSGGFHTFMTDGEVLREKWVNVRCISTNFDKLDPLTYDVAFISVGPRNTTRLPAGIEKLRCPIFSLENDPITVDWIKQAYGLKLVYFGVPDVITSSTASPENLLRDGFAIHTENGVLYLQRPLELDSALERLFTEVHWLPAERLNQEWDAKLYIHNTPHCIAAYLGHMAGCTYLHEALAKPAIKRAVDGVIDELLCALKLVTPYDHHFIESYATKEVRRFSNRLLFDPVSRVAREPLRKLHPSGRLMGALRLLLSAGVNPTYLMAGIASALCYDDRNDRDYIQLCELGEFGVPAFLKYHLGMNEESIESEYVTKHYADAFHFLEREIV